MPTPKSSSSMRQISTSIHASDSPGRVVLNKPPSPPREEPQTLCGRRPACAYRALGLGRTRAQELHFVSKAARCGAPTLSPRPTYRAHSGQLHRSQNRTRRWLAGWLAENPKFELLFQPAYYPWTNQSERLWKAMHDTVNRNHRCTTLYERCQNVKRFSTWSNPSQVLNTV